MRHLISDCGEGRVAAPLAMAAAILVLAAATPAGGAPTGRIDEARSSASATAAVCASERAQSAVLSAVAGGEMTLADGRVVRLAAVDIPDTMRAEAARRLGAHVGQALLVRPLSPTGDRWGRIVAQIFVTNSEVDQTTRASLGEALLSAGLARVDPGQGGGDDAGCYARLLAAEARARQARLGLWSRAGEGVKQAGDTESILKNTGDFVVLEGRVLSVGERQERTYINFGRRWSEDTTVTIAKRYWRMMAKTGVTAETLRGKRIRVRGVVENHGGPLIEVTEAAQIEFIEADRAQ